ncbi:hypothetical protein C2E21_6023 [Chlorella sorokiniana]|uniref:Uncharacterized protein n=1 Tax=Chlorella sorokiniana TaxID=3076 RepID=A0A2P6TLY1_CHLSO|nr:hypothetical protein C2E21_6023 [Chlorella sorokiniana]|eukprot:PRW45346.1 hypothetical protein C2E21_6023 [Chlorella sorokiniana]
MEGAAAPAGAPAAEPARVALITKPGCPHCKRSKAALQEAGLPFEQYELSDQLEVLAAIKAATGQATVPQVFVAGRLLGGATELEAALVDGSLRQQLAGASAAALPAELQELLQRKAAGQGEAAGVKAAAGEEGSKHAVLEQLVAELRGALAAPSSDRTFTLQAAVQWLQQRQACTQDAAVAALAELQAAQLVAVAAPAGSRDAELPLSQQLVQQRPRLLLRLVDDAPPPRRWREPLNGRFPWFGPARPAEQVAESLRQSLLRLYDRHLAADGRRVRYAALQADPEWRRFVAAAAELQKVDLAGLSSREQRMAFFINIYNVLVVHALVVFGAANGTLSRLRWFDSISYLIGGQRFSSNDIEHGVLRGNKPSPASLFSLLGKPQWAGPTFKAGDPRAALAVSPPDPRIHFALNCGAASCPAIRVFTPASLELGLEAAAEAFCAGEVRVDAAGCQIDLSMIFKWYGGDFGPKQQLLQFLATHLPAGPAGELRGMLAAQGADAVKLTYRPYNWSTNAAA